MREDPGVPRQQHYCYYFGPFSYSHWNFFGCCWSFAQFSRVFSWSGRLMVGFTLWQIDVIGRLERLSEAEVGLCGKCPQHADCSQIAASSIHLIGDGVVASSHVRMIARQELSGCSFWANWVRQMVACHPLRPRVDCQDSQDHVGSSMFASSLWFLWMFNLFCLCFEETIIVIKINNIFFIIINSSNQS